MTKRMLIIIIGLLAIIDLAAGLWYLTLRIEAQGERDEQFEHADIVPGSVTAADTLADSSVPDTFAIIADAAYFVSEHPAPADDHNTHYASIKQLKVRWPKSINGSQNTITLERALLRKMYGHEYRDLEAAVATELKDPDFGLAVNIDARKVDHPPVLHNGYGRADKVLAYPLTTSFRLLVMEIDHDRYNGNTHSTTTAYVHYDRFTHKVLNRHDILLPENENVVLAMINQKIDSLNVKGQKFKLLSASAVPAEFCVKRTGLMFDFPAGEVADVTEGPIEILVRYPNLKGCLTESFIDLLNSNGGYWDYKRLHIEDDE